MMTKIAARWLPLAAAVTIVCGLVYLGVQQVWRHGADDPQLQMAGEIADALRSGAVAASVVPTMAIDFGRSLTPFVMILDEAGAVLASSGRLGSGSRTIPDGVLRHVRTAGEERVTWQPEPGVRIATVVIHLASRTGGFVIVGRSLRETDRRIGQFGTIVRIVWFGSLVGLLGLTALMARWT